MRRGEFWVKRNLQIKYLLITVGIVIIASVCVYYVVWQTLLQSSFMENLGMMEFQEVKKDIIMSFFWIILVLIVAMGFESVLLFHRIIGPIYVIEKVIKRMSGGHLVKQLKFREKDELKDLAKEIENMSINLRGFLIEDKKRIETVKGELGALLEDIEKNRLQPQKAREIIGKIKAELDQINKDFKLDVNE